MFCAGLGHRGFSGFLIAFREVAHSCRALSDCTDDEDVEDGEHREWEERVDASVEPLPHVEQEVAVRHVQRRRPAEETPRTSGDLVRDHRAREEIRHVEREDRHGNAGDDVDGLAAREVHVRPEREPDGDVTLGCHGDEKRDGEMDGEVEGEQDELARPDACRVHVATHPPHEGDHQRQRVTSADGAHVQARAVLAHAPAERHDERQNVGNESSQRNERLIVEPDSIVNIELDIVGFLCWRNVQQTGLVCVVQHRRDRTVERFVNRH